MNTKDQILLEKAYTEVKQEGILRNSVCNCCGSILTKEEIYHSNQRQLNEERVNSNGYIIYHGISNGEKIVCIATGFNDRSSNEKTGPMIQVYIMLADVEPTVAVKTGQDKGVCFNCAMRGKGCYVNLGQGVGNIYQSYKKGNYPSICPPNTKFDNTNVESKISTYLEMGDWDKFRGEYVRFGAYGEPIVIPFSIIEKIANVSKGITGYTHQWKNPMFSSYKKYLMASIDTPSQYETAKNMGWKTFRISPNWFVKKKNEIPCTNAIDGTLCIDCLKCCGNSMNEKDIYIKVHGMAYKVNKFLSTFGRGDAADDITPEELEQINKINQKEAERLKMLKINRKSRAEVKKLRMTHFLIDFHK